MFHLNVLAYSFVTHHDAVLSGVNIPECLMKVFVAWTTNDIETFKYCFRSNICRCILKAEGIITFSRRRRLSVTDVIIDLDLHQIKQY